jgi:hypothetical protein
VHPAPQREDGARGRRLRSPAAGVRALRATVVRAADIAFSGWHGTGEATGRPPSDGTSVQAPRGGGGRSEVRQGKGADRRVSLRAPTWELGVPGRTAPSGRPRDR